jgi:hypothetical protein
LGVHVSATADASRANSTLCMTIATDSKGNIFTTETYRGQRVQKFVYKKEFFGTERQLAEMINLAIKF